MQIFSDQLHDRFRRKPVSSSLIALTLVIVFAIVGEFSVGFVDGMIAGFTDGV